MTCSWWRFTQPANISIRKFSEGASGNIVTYYNVEKIVLRCDPHIRDRIFVAADELFAASETREFPNVETVRERSRANMNYVVEAMQEWRRHKRQSVQAVREPLPEPLQDAITTMARGLWETALRLANESLDAARSAFEAEKADIAKVSAEQCEAFEGLHSAHEKLHREFNQLQTQVTPIEAVRELLKKTEREAYLANSRADGYKERAERAEGKAHEIEQRLRSTLRS
jgi:colicin import membrane protein